MADKSKGILVARNVCALDIAATKSRSRTFYSKRKSNPRLASAIKIANAVQAYGMDANSRSPTGHPNEKTITPISERPQGFTRTDLIPVVGDELPHPGAPARHNDVSDALRALDAVNPQAEKMAAALAKLADEVVAGKRTPESAQAEAKRMFPGVDSDSIDLSHVTTDAQATDSGLSVQQIIDSL